MKLNQSQMKELQDIRDRLGFSCATDIECCSASVASLIGWTIGPESGNSKDMPADTYGKEVIIRMNNGNVARGVVSSDGITNFEQSGPWDNIVAYLVQ